MAELNKTEQEFKDKLFALLREYNVEMEVVEESSGWHFVPTGISFFAYEQYDDNYEPMGKFIDFTIGTWENGKE